MPLIYVAWLIMSVGLNVNWLGGKYQKNNNQFHFSIYADRKMLAYGYGSFRWGSTIKALHDEISTFGALIRYNDFICANMQRFSFLTHIHYGFVDNCWCRTLLIYLLNILITIYYWKIMQRLQGLQSKTSKMATLY